MKNNYSYSYLNNSYQYYPSNYQSDERLIGTGFVGPFILGGLTGGLVAPLFYGNGYGYGNNRPPVYYYQPGPYRPPYYGRPY